MTKYSIKQAAQATGISVATLRYYEQEGLLRGIERLANGHRRYSQQDIMWIEFLICLRDSGMLIQELKRYVAVSDRPQIIERNCADGLAVSGLLKRELIGGRLLSYQPGTGHERCELLEAHRTALETKITHLQNRLERIDEKIAWYHERLALLPEKDLVSIPKRHGGKIEA